MKMHFKQKQLVLVAVQLRRKLEQDPILFLQQPNTLSVFLFQKVFNRRCIDKDLLLIYITNQPAIVQFLMISDLRKAIL